MILAPVESRQSMISATGVRARSRNWDQSKRSAVGVRSVGKWATERHEQSRDDKTADNHKMGPGKHGSSTGNFPVIPEQSTV